MGRQEKGDKEKEDKEEDDNKGGGEPGSQGEGGQGRQGGGQQGEKLIFSNPKSWTLAGGRIRIPPVRIRIRILPALRIRILHNCKLM